MTRLDVAIVGAGPAGASLALFLSSLGFKVALIDRLTADRLGSKPCGDAVPAVWFHASKLCRLAKPGEGEASPLGGLKVDGVELRGPAYAVDRPRWVRRMVSEAEGYGCRVVLGREARPLRGAVLAGNHVVEAEVVVDARGFRASGARPPDVGLALREIVEGRAEGGLMQVKLRPGLPGYSWVVPKGGSLNVGVCILKGHGLRVDLKGWLSSFKRAMGLEGRILDRGYGLIPTTGTLSLVEGGVVKVGDASRAVNPATGEGIGPSILQSYLLASSLSRGEGVEGYVRAVKLTLGPLLRLSKALRGAAWRSPRAFAMSTCIPYLSPVLASRIAT